MPIPAEDMAQEYPLVSVIMPTYKRPESVVLAARSVLSQTYPNIELVVVSDCHDDVARAAVEGLNDSRVRYMEMEKNSGPAEARNAGVAASRGDWLAFLDDDDLMLPQAIERQMSAADPSHPERIIASRVIFRHDGRDDVWPDRPVRDDEDIADYLFVRPSIFGRPGILTMQCMLVHRSLCEAVRFSTHPEHEDWAWILEVWHRAGARFRFVWEPLVVYTIDTGSQSRSRRFNWTDTILFADRHRQWISDRSYASLLSTKVALKAKRAGDWRKMPWIAKKVLACHPTPLDLLFLAGAFLFPAGILQGVWKYTLRAKKA